MKQFLALIFFSLSSVAMEDVFVCSRNIIQAELSDHQKQADQQFDTVLSQLQPQADDLLNQLQQETNHITFVALTRAFASLVEADKGIMSSECHDKIFHNFRNCEIKIESESYKNCYACTYLKALAWARKHVENKTLNAPCWNKRFPQFETQAGTVEPSQIAPIRLSNLARVEKELENFHEGKITLRGMLENKSITFKTTEKNFTEILIKTSSYTNEQPSEDISTAFEKLAMTQKEKIKFTGMYKNKPVEVFIAQELVKKIIGNKETGECHIS